MTPNQTKLRRAKHFLAAIDDGCNEIATLFDLIEQAQSAPAEVAQGDDVFVVGYYCRDEKGLATLNWLPHENALPLMTVAQHNRTVAALTAPPSPDAELVELLAKLRQMVCATPQDDIDRCDVWISAKHPVIERIDAKLASLK
jgi:hypothetical protein